METRDLMARLERQPHLKARFEALLDIAESATGEYIVADEVEECLINEINHLGNEILNNWAVSQEAKIRTSLTLGKPTKKHSKKN